MPGNVLVDDTEIEKVPPSPSPWWLVGLGAIAVVVLVALTGQPAGVPTQTTLALPEVVVPEDRWSPLELPGTGTLTDVAATATGHVAVGMGPQIWRSSDRTTWEWVPLPDSRAGGAAAVVAFDRGAVAVGSQSEDGVISEATVLRTDTGLTWKQVTVPVDAPAGLEGVTLAGGHLAAWGWRGSPDDFGPDSEPLLITSDDGDRWRDIRMPENLRISSVTRLGETWYASGLASGRAALWSSPDLETWAQVPMSELPFGWDIRRVTYEGDSLVADLVRLDEEGFRRWRQNEDGTWVAVDSEPGLSFDVITAGGNDFGVGAGRLWSREEDEWKPMTLDGQILAGSDGVAVGGDAGQPIIWTDAIDPTYLPAVVAGDHWEEVTDLGEEAYVGSWRAATGWVVAGANRWWFIDGNGTHEISPPGPTESIQRIGDEWVALPGMYWTSNAIDWEQRAEPWDLGGTAKVEAISTVDGRILAIGRDAESLWAVAVSPDQGHSWELVDSPARATPIWAVIGTPGGFAATVDLAFVEGNVVLGSRGPDPIAGEGVVVRSADVVVSRDGRNWQLLVSGGVFPPQTRRPPSPHPANSSTLSLVSRLSCRESTYEGCGGTARISWFQRAAACGSVPMKGGRRSRSIRPMAWRDSSIRYRSTSASW